MRGNHTSVTKVGRFGVLRAVSTYLYYLVDLVDEGTLTKVRPDLFTRSLHAHNGI
jgi:hypothetical protein